MDSSHGERPVTPGSWKTAVREGGVGADRYKWQVLASVVVGLFMVILDATVVNVALRALQEKFVASTSDVQWVISLYTLALGVATPLSGFLGDRLGAKRVYIGGLLIFVLGSALCGLAPNLGLLIAARALQGIGGGIALPLATALLFGAFPPEQRGLAFGIFGIVLVFAPASGPLLGGWLVDQGQVPWIFFINVPIGLAGAGIAGRLLRAEPARAARADLAGIVLAPLGFGALLFAASVAGEPGAGWGDWRVLAGLGLGLAALLALVVAELRAPEPLLDLRLLGIRSFAVAGVVGMVGSVALFGAEFLLPLYLQVLRGRTAFEAGLFLLPLALTSGVVSPLAGKITDRVGPRLPILVGFLLLVFNTYQLSHITLSTSLTLIAVLAALRGIGVALVIQTTQVAALSDVPFTRIRRATPLLRSFQQTMQAIGVALLATIAAGAVTLRQPSVGATAAAVGRFQQKYLTGLEHAYVAALAISIVATALACFLPGWPGAYSRRTAPAGRASATPVATRTSGLATGAAMTNVPRPFEARRPEGAQA